MVYQQITRDAGHPGGKAAVRRMITGQRAIDPEKHFLGQVFRLGAIAGKPVANVEDAARMATHKFLPGRPVALEALLDQLSILLQRIISLKSCYGAKGEGQRSLP